MRQEVCSRSAKSMEQAGGQIARRFRNLDRGAAASGSLVNALVAEWAYLQSHLESHKLTTTCEPGFRLCHLRHALVSVTMLGSSNLPPVTRALPLHIHVPGLIQHVDHLLRKRPFLQIGQ